LSGSCRELFPEISAVTTATEHQAAANLKRPQGIPLPEAGANEAGHRVAAI
jgi:hypothetical protein